MAEKLSRPFYRFFPALCLFLSAILHTFGRKTAKQTSTLYGNQNKINSSDGNNGAVPSFSFALRSQV
jgi:hypothetical protein